jgi:hypothetical protein
VPAGGAIVHRVLGFLPLAASGKAIIAIAVVGAILLLLLALRGET